MELNDNPVKMYVLYKFYNFINLQSSKSKYVAYNIMGDKLLLKGPLKYLLMPLLGKNQLAITLHLYASIGPNLDNTHRGHI